MARARNIKPKLFLNELLGVADPLLTILFTSLWCLADRAGRLEDRPLRIKAETFPYRENLDVNGYLTELQRMGFISRYTEGGMALIQVCKFHEHQTPHNTEKASILPAQSANSLITLDNATLTVKDALRNDGLTDEERPDSLIPDSLIPDSGLTDTAPHAARAAAPKNEDFELAFAAFPKRLGGNPKHDALKAWNARIAEGALAADMIAGAKRYAEFNRIAGKVGTEYVMQAVRFFGKSRHFDEPWAIEPAPRAPSRITAAMGANAIPFDDPFAKREAA